MIGRSVRALAAVALALWLSGAPARCQDTSAATTRSLDAATNELRLLNRTAERGTDAAQQQRLRNRASDIERIARTDLAALQSDLARLDAQAQQLGPRPKNLIETPDILAKRAELSRSHGLIDSAVKRAKLLGLEANQLVATLEQRRADAISDMLTARSASPLGAGFWRSVARDFPQDRARIETFVAAEGQAVGTSLDSGRGWIMLVGALAAIIVVGPVRGLLRRAGQRIMIDHAPATRLRRSALAFWFALLGVVLPLLGAVAFVRSVEVAGALSPAWAPLARSFEMAVLLAALVDALGSALLQRRQSSWRLMPIGDDVARLLRPWTQAVAAVVAFTILVTAVADAARISAGGLGVLHLFISVLQIALALAVLITAGRIRLDVAQRTADDASDDRSLASSALASLVCWIVVVVAIAALLIGYGSLGLMLSRMLLWVPTVAAALYLLLVTVDDACSELVAGTSKLGATAHAAFGLRLNVIDQAGVVLSALIRIVLVVIAIGAVFAPFGTNLDSLLDAVGSISGGVTVANVTIEPGSILRAIAVVAVGSLLVRLVQHWLADRYLPTTAFDLGSRNSIATIASYLGIILVALLAFTALGVSLSRIGLILSALSVGIGFGLQAVTQNFVSGLILLIERPVKIGDLIRVGDQEGDVKRISVRSTEIVIADRSTLIVPNSELITKSIRNMTLADPIGRVQIRFAVPLDKEIGLVRDLVMQLFASSKALLDDPAPRVFLDTLEGSEAHFNCVAYVRSPRDSYGVRSELLFDLIAALRAAAIDVSAWGSDASSSTPTGKAGQAGAAEDDSA